MGRAEPQCIEGGPWVNIDRAPNRRPPPSSTEMPASHLPSIALLKLSYVARSTRLTIEVSIVPGCRWFWLEDCLEAPALRRWGEGGGMASPTLTWGSYDSDPSVIARWPRQAERGNTKRVARRSCGPGRANAREGHPLALHLCRLAQCTKNRLLSEVLLCPLSTTARQQTTLPGHRVCFRSSAQAGDEALDDG
jgi:hypothetical protein